MLVTFVFYCTYFTGALVGCSCSREGECVFPSSEICSRSREEECIFSSSEVCPRSRAGECVFPASEIKFIHVKGNVSSLQVNLFVGAQATSRAAPSAGAHCHWGGCS